MLHCHLRRVCVQQGQALNALPAEVVPHAELAVHSAAG